MRCDVVVIGLGGMGSAILYELALRGVSAVGIERYEIPSERGSTQGPTRTFREAYFTDPRYVSMARRSRERWLELEEEHGATLFEPTGAVFVGPEEHPGVRGLAGSLATNDLPHERLDADELARRWPIFRPAPDEIGMLEIRAGLLRVPRTMHAHVEGAARRGAALRPGEEVLELTVNGSSVEVRTATERYEAGAAVVTLGPWWARGIGDASVLGYRPPLDVRRQAQIFFEPPPGLEPCPFNYVRRTDGPGFYGAPDRGRGIMIAQHHGGEESTAPADPALRPAERDAVRDFIESRMSLDATPRSSIVGLYTNTPDGHFLLGHHPTTDRVVVAGGFSGHGYKFAPVIGEIVADLVTRGTTEWDIALFAPDRFGAAG